MAEGPAHNIELEQSLIGAILLNNHAFDYIDGLRAEHLYEPIHQRIFDACKSLYEAGKPATPLTIKSIFPADLKIADITASQYIARLAASATTVINAKDYAENIRALWMIRETQGVLDKLTNHQQHSLFPTDALREAFQELDTIRLDHPQQSLITTAGASGESFVGRMTGIMTGKIAVTGVPTGIADFDRMTGGFKGGDLVVLAGRPGMGKSSVAATCARNAARAGYGVGLFSHEMSQEQLMARMLCDEAYDEPGGPIEYNNAINPKRLSMEHAERLHDAQRRLLELPMMIDYSSHLTVGEIAARARSMALTLKRKYGAPLKLLVLDYLKFIKASERYRGQRVYEIGEICGALKQIAKDMDLVVLLLAQLSRKVEEREEKIPELSDLRDSGEIEQDADVVILLYRRAYYLQNNPKTLNDANLQAELVTCINTLLMIVAKQRSGPTGSVAVFCNMGASAIRSLARPEEIDLRNQ